jgi:transposase
MTLSITRTELTAEQLRAAAARETTARTARRMLAVAMVLAGHSRQAAAESQGMDRQTLRDWVMRYNEQGLAGLLDRPRSGRPSMLGTDQEAEIKTWIEQGPDPNEDGVIRWRRWDLRERIRARFGVTMHERSVGKLLRRLNFRRISVRPQHPESDEAAQQAFKKTSPARSAPRSRRRAPSTGRSRSGFRMKPGSASKAR